MVTASVRLAIESLYEGECDIFEYQEVKDPVTKITKHAEAATPIQNQPCRLSFEKINPTNPTESAAGVALSGKLFISPDLIIKAGSKIVVTQSGRTFEFKSSGEPAVYGSHQSVMLELFKGWS